MITQTFGKFAAIESYSLDKVLDDANPTRKRGTSKKKADKKTFGSKIFHSYEFGYRRITIERPLRLSVQFTDERLETLRFDSGKLNAAMQKIYEQFPAAFTASSAERPVTSASPRPVLRAEGLGVRGNRAPRTVTSSRSKPKCEL